MDRRAPRRACVRREDALQRRVMEALRFAFGDRVKWNVQATSLVPHAKRGQYKALGYQVGTLDFTMLMQRGIYNGLVIDFKETSSPTKEQRETAAVLRKEGYLVGFTRGYKKTMALIRAYTSLKPGARIKLYPRKALEVLAPVEDLADAVNLLRGVWNDES